MGSPSAATTSTSAASLSQGCMRAGAARRSSGCAAFNARRPVLPDGTHSHHRCRITSHAVRHHLRHSDPSPACGGGTGRGHATTFVQAHPLPNPPPQAGEGAHRVFGQGAYRVRGSFGEPLPNRCYSDHSLQRRIPMPPVLALYEDVLADGAALALPAAARMILLVH